jgi:hypothetical protein
MIVVGYCDRLGYLRCVHCVDPEAIAAPDAEGYQSPIGLDSPPHNVELCDTCGRRLCDAFETPKRTRQQYDSRTL